MDKVYAVTGHRPQSLDGDDDYKSPVWQGMRRWFDKHLELFPAKYVITGGALGVDQFLAKRSFELGVPFSIIMPFEGQADQWESKHVKRLEWLKERADEVRVLYPGGYSPGKMHGRNHYMVDKAEHVLGVWNGLPEGGTYRCLEYTRQVKKPWSIYTPPGHLYNYQRFDNGN